MEKLLVANRGEIACRIFASARRLGLTCVAVYSDADAGARHVREADEAYHLGPAPARDSYLNIERVLAAAHDTGADTIHPGYGFLAESAEFAAACAAAGLCFVGPPAEVIRSMGSKARARARARALGIPVLPGYEGEAQSIPELCAAALRLGFPLIIKPAGGGGGKGMAVVDHPGDGAAEESLAAALQAARRLAQSSFGDGTLVLERYLAAPRHIEVQVLVDSQGNALSLGDRDCSIQRRHQKLIEEAPAPGLPQALRAGLAAAAVTLARDVGYVSAGTVEFLVEGEHFYFLEMNTRLQVEHPVTEAITGLDLVEWQLRVVRGEALGLTQERVRLEGAAIEARVCAEDPARDFLPSAGELELLQWPQGESLRVDAGFESGDRVPDSYDSLLGKVIAWAPSREEARAQLAQALDETCCVGVRSNERWLARIVRDPCFAAARHSVAFLGAGAAQLSAATPIDERVLALAALVAHAQHSPGQAASTLSPWEMSDAFMPNLPAAMTYAFKAQGTARAAVLSLAGGQPLSVTVGPDGSALPAAHVQVTRDEVSAQLGAHRVRARYFVGPDRIHLWMKDAHHEVLREAPRRLSSSNTATEQRLSTPLPGVVVSVAVAPGEKVAAGALLMVIEAMKMEHPIKAPCAGTVKAIHVRVGERVKEDTELLELALVGQT